MNFFRKKRIYLDYAATTPLDSRVFAEMKKVYEDGYFNPGALYKEGVLAAQKIAEARRSVAAHLGTTSDHIIFSRGGTESDNLAITGVIQKFKENNPEKIPHVIVSEIEHSAVLETVKSFGKEIELSIVSVDEEGVVDMVELKKMLRPETVLISVMYVNNEIGTIQPIKEIAKLVRWYKKQKNENLKSKEETYPLFHTDAIQAANFLDIHVDRLGVDLLSLSGSKIYGPKSCGILYVRERGNISPMIFGGDQEFELRAGTEDIAQIVGFTKALDIARNESLAAGDHLKSLQAYFFEELGKNIPDMKINGIYSNELSDGSRAGESQMKRICNNINISIPGISSERLVIELDAAGICASSKSACKEDSDEESYVIAALRNAVLRKDLKKNGPEKNQSLTNHEGTKETGGTEGSIRFTMGRETTRKEIEKTVSVLAHIVEKIRNFVL